jgi:hypothetical protein
VCLARGERCLDRVVPGRLVRQGQLGLDLLRPVEERRVAGLEPLGRPVRPAARAADTEPAGDVARSDARLRDGANPGADA